MASSFPGRPYHHQCCQHVPIASWWTVSEHLGSGTRVLEKNVKSATLYYIENNGQALRKESDMLEALNHYFVSVVRNLAKQIDTQLEDR